MNQSLRLEQPGVWVNPAWSPGTPGTFALVIGVSDYTVLDGGSESLRLGKLPVSALSAFRFFEWLEQRYLISGCPLAKVWLLLAPREQELQLAPRMKDAALSPDFDACYKAIHGWFDEMKRLPAVAAGASRSIFFFSGHGLEQIEDRQFLLPRDYAPVENVERALATDNLARGLKVLKVPLHFLFFDACRGDYDKSSEYAPLIGWKVLNEPSSKTANKGTKVSRVQASAAGDTAWSPEIEKGELSVFAQALLEGLTAKGLRPECIPEKCFVYLRILEPFLHIRMPEILRGQYRSSESQEPSVRGDQVLQEVTELSSLQPEDRLPPSPPPPIVGTPGPTSPIYGEVYGIRVEPGATGKISEEKVSSLLEQARVYSFSSNAWLPDGSVEITNLRRQAGNYSYEFDLRMPRVPKGRLCWLEISNHLQTVGCALPVDSVENTVFHGTLAVAPQRVAMVNAPLAIVRLKVTLSPESGGLLGEAVRLWIKAEKGVLSLSDLQTTLLKMPLPEIRSQIDGSRLSPIAATLTAAVLAQASQWDLYGDWVRAITTANPNMTDGSVLWTERCLQEDETPGEALKYFMLMDSSTLPIFSHTISLALRQAEYYRSLEVLPEVFRAAILRIYGRLIDAVETYRPGGLFASFIGRTGQVSSGTIAAPEVRDDRRMALSRAALTPRISTRPISAIQEAVWAIENAAKEAAAILDSRAVSEPEVAEASEGELAAE